MTIQQKIFKTMKEKGINQSELSRKTGIPTSTISDWKNKNKVPSSDKISVIAKALDVPADYLISEPNRINLVSPNEASGKSFSEYYPQIDSTTNQLLSVYNALSLSDKAKALSYVCQLAEKQGE